ncbi:MAG: DUF6659 family protein [Nitrosopumilus sp.]
MSVSTKEFTLQKELTKEILQIDPHIRFVGIINYHGKLSISSIQNNIKLQVPKDECEMLYMEAALRMRMHQEFDHCLGLVNFCMIHRRNFIITKYPFGNDIVYVSADRNFDFSKTPFKIIEILKKEVKSG